MRHVTAQKQHGRMQVVKNVSAMQRLALKWRRNGLGVALVPTMGYLHAGHISLVERARKAVGPRGVVVVSIYVNPTQFGPKEDLSRYPRDLQRDSKLCREAGADVIFVPTDESMYPGKEKATFSTYVVEENLSRGMEGASRPTHFKGVTTVVAKLFNIVLPDIAVFGAKDFQQAAVVRRMVGDLNFPLKIVITPTMREPDGLAMSSRNKYLNLEQRKQATALSQAIRFARDLTKKAERPIATKRLRRELKSWMEKHPEVRVDYIEVFDPDTLKPLATVTSRAHLALAAFVGKTRLIDNGNL